MDLGSSLLALGGWYILSTVVPAGMLAVLIPTCAGFVLNGLKPFRSGVESCVLRAILFATT